MRAVGKPEAKSEAKLGPVSIAVFVDAISRIEVGPKPVNSSKPLQQATKIFPFKINACASTKDRSFCIGTAINTMEHSLILLISLVTIIVCGKM